MGEDGSIIDLLPGLVWTALPDGQADFVNKRWCGYTGVAFDQALGAGWLNAIHPDDQAHALDGRRAMVASGIGSELEARLRRFDGVHRWFLFRTGPIADETGRISRWCGINTDIEDRKQAERALQLCDTQQPRNEQALNDVRAQLAQMARVTALGALTASIAHEVNQPLSGIITNAGAGLKMLDADPPNIAGARETVRRTMRDGNRAADVIKRLRALFVQKGAAHEPLDLNEAARDLIALSVGDLQRRRVVVRLDLAAALPLVTGDRAQLQQVILNLLLNAADAMSDVEGRPRQVSIVTRHDGAGRISLAVSDTGAGLAPDSAGRLFEAFFTTKSEAMGIGLAVSRSIIDSHGGQLIAAPNDGPGATFTFTLPSRPDDPGGGSDLNPPRRDARQTLMVQR